MRIAPLRSFFAGWAPVLLMVSCGAATETLEVRFAREEACSEPVRIHSSGPRFAAEGCGKRVTYVCTTSPLTNSKKDCQRADLPPPPGASLDRPTYPTPQGDQVAPGAHP